MLFSDKSVARSPAVFLSFKLIVPYFTIFFMLPDADLGGRSIIADLA
jgi:hypothetical protein